MRLHFTIILLSATTIAGAQTQTLSGTLSGPATNGHRVISVGGGTMTAGDGRQISFTLGQTFTQTHTAGNKMLTNGFWQPRFGNICGPMDECVRPGDIDRNDTVDMHDFIYLGFAYGATGPPRSDTSTDFMFFPATPWGRMLPGGVNFAHADFNGDGIVNLLDSVAISRNFTHYVPDSQVLFDDVRRGPLCLGAAIQIDDTTWKVPVILGDTANEVNNIYTLSFFTQVLGVGGQEIQNVETQLMDTAFNGQRNGNWIGMNEKNPSNSINAVGIAGLDSLNRDNCANDTLGQIVIKEDISKLLPADVLLHGIVGTDSSGQIINLGPINIQIFPFGPRISTPDQVKLYPNPAQQLIYLSTFDEALPEVVEIMDVAGRKTKLKPLNTSPNVITLDIAHLPAGIYFVKLKTPNGMQTVKFVKMGN